MSTQIPPQICSPRPVHSPPVVICVVPVSVPSVWPVDDDSLPDEVDALSEPDVDVSGPVVELFAVDDESELVGAAVDDAVISEVEVGALLVLDIESVPAAVPLVVTMAVSPPGSSPLQAARLRPTSAATTTGAAHGIWRSAAAQNGQRLSRSNR